MPFYDYECSRCSATVELLHGIEDVTKRTHEGCGGALERRFTATSVHFKGSGWAKLERRGGGGGAPATGSASEAGSSPSPSATSNSVPSAAPAKTSGGSGE
ncbi:MAG: FmdB family zinc ribbon protein [Candidatus Limnocylindrus sp.]